MTYLGTNTLGYTFGIFSINNLTIFPYSDNCIMGALYSDNFIGGTPEFTDGAPRFIGGTPRAAFPTG
jgi:hypothetical protein